MDLATMLAGLEFTRNRLMGTLDAIEKASTEKGIAAREVLGWRPGPGRAHIAWQAMHCAATHDKYLNVTLRGGKVKDETLVANFASGSTPSDMDVPPFATIREKLAATFADFKSYVAGLDAQGIARSIPGPNNTQRTVGESIILLTWHEAHHQGQIHLTWNMFKAAHNVS